MNRLYAFMRTIYHSLPIPLAAKRKVHGFLSKYRKDINSMGIVPIDARVPDRKSLILSRISPATQEGLEIGPLCWPLVTKTESNGRIYYVDFSTAEKSREKYKDDPNVDVNEIVETDYLWGKQTLPELVEGKLFDYVVASHVIEHVPNMLGWLREIASVLKDNGILALAIPDKRYTFDFKRQLTTLGVLVESYLLDKRRPGIKDIFDQVSLATKVDSYEAWSGKLDPSKLIHHGTPQEALVQAQKYFLSDEYNDVHVNILTPSSFLDILEQSAKIGLFDFTVADLYPTAKNSHEFLVSLQRLPRDLAKENALQLQIESFEKARKLTQTYRHLLNP